MRLLTLDFWVAWVMFLYGNIIGSTKKKDVNVLQAKLGHPMDEIPQAIRWATGFHITGIFKLCTGIFKLCVNYIEWYWFWMELFFKRKIEIWWCH